MLMSREERVKMMKGERFAMDGWMDGCRIGERLKKGAKENKEAL